MMSKPSTPLSKKPPLPALQRTASESATTTMIMRGRRMELGGLQSLHEGQGGQGGKLVHDALFSPSGSVASATDTTVSDASVRRAFSMV